MSLPNVPQPDRDGAAVLNAVAGFVGRFVRFPDEHCLTAVVLWIAHTHAAHRFYVTPRLVLDSAEPGSGKTRVLELLALLCSAPKLTISATVAALYRRIAQAKAPLTILLDEVDAIFNPKAPPQAEDLRALLNSGYKRGATVDRCVGDAKSMKVVEFPVFTPCALAGLAGRMPATITTRAVVIHMRRRAPGEHVEPFRERDAAWDAEPLRTDIAGWVEQVADDLEFARPEMPDGVVDRPAEVWEALLAVADAAGGRWPDIARAACRHFVLAADPEELSFGVRLLGHVRDVFAAEGVDRMTSAALVERLVALEESPYADLWGKPLDQRRLARELGRYDVRARSLRLSDGAVRRGYATDEECGLPDAWHRYLTTGATSATAATPLVSGMNGNQAVALPSATAAETDVADRSATAHGPEPGLTSGVAPVADVAPIRGRWRASGNEI